jgi:hypothetical protein
MRFAKQLPIGKTDFRFEVETTRNKKIKAENESNRNLYLGVRAIGVLALLMIAAIAWMILSPDFTQSKVKNPVLALEFIQTPGELSTILGTDNPEHIRQELLDAIRRDYFFIASYALLYIALSLLLARRYHRRWAVHLAWLGAMCGIGAALFDVRENMSMVHLLTAPPTQETVSTIHLAATVKWTLSFITAAILAMNFYASDGWLLLIGWLLRVTAVLGVISLLYLPLLMWALGAMVLALFLLIIRALFQPAKFIDEL